MENSVARSDLMSALTPESPAGITAACFLSALLCLSERLLTFAYDRRWTPFYLETRWCIALWQSFLYWLVTLFRLAYMVVAMATLTISPGYAVLLVIILVTSLATGQFLIELQGNPSREHETYNLLNTASPMINRPRSKSKPDAIFIHPIDSNLARADARVLELGLGGETDRVARAASPPPRRPGSWSTGAGRAAARALLHTTDHTEKDPERRQLWSPSSPESDGYD